MFLGPNPVPKTFTTNAKTSCGFLNIQISKLVIVEIMKSNRPIFITYKQQNIRKIEKK
jgi:hypothetical protein